MELSFYASRQYYIDSDKGVVNAYYDENDSHPVVDETFSGEITYKCVFRDIPDGNYILDIDDVKHFAKIYINGKKEGISTMPPYRFMLNDVKSGDELKIVVANTIAGACASTDCFDKTDVKLIGTYHQNMVQHERAEMTAPKISGAKIIRV